MEKVSWLRGTCIGRGSFGTVNLAADRSDGRLFAVKSVEMRPSLSIQLDALENEIRILRSMSSPYVIEYLGDDVTSNSGASSFRNLHVEYLPGGTVADLAKLPGANVDEATVQSYTWCILSALRYVHARGIAHCDVKGRNVLVGSTHGAAKLADFGSAKELSSFLGELPRGSPLWMAPEVIRLEYQGPESDVWSLGCTVIEMVTGKPAWEDRGADTLIQIGYSDGLPEFPAQLSELGRDFLEKCLRRNPAERWSCNQLLQHPFVSSCSPPIMGTDWSPKCVLDRFDSNFSDEEIDQENSISISISSSHWNWNSNARERIKQLATKSGAIWESDGWVNVRTSVNEENSETCSSSGGGGAIWSFQDLGMTEEETTWTSLEYSNSKRRKREYLDTNVCPPVAVDFGWGGVEAGSSCRHGFRFSEMEVCGINSCCNLRLSYYKNYRCNVYVPCFSIYYLLDLINIWFILLIWGSLRTYM